MEQKTQSSAKKIMFLITKSNFGGAQKYVYELALEAQKRGFETSVALGGQGLLYTKLKDSGISVHSIKSLQRDINIFSEIKSFFEILTLLHVTKPDVLHVNSSKAGGVGALAGRLCGIKKIVFTIHGWAFNENRSWLHKLIIKKLYWTIIFLSHVSIAVSEHTKKQAQSIPCYFLIKNKIIVIKNGILPISFLDRTSAQKFLEETYNIPSTKKIIGTLAELHPIKGLEFLIRAAKNIPNKESWVILIFGTGQEEEKLRSLIKELNLENNVILGGFLKNGSSYLKAFDVFILPSLSEAMPLSIIEAGQAEIAVIATEVGGIREIIEHRKTGLLIQPHDSTEIQNAVETLLGNENLATELANNLKQKIERDFRFDEFTTKTFNLYTN